MNRGELETYLAARRREVEGELQRLLGKRAADRPAELHRAMRYAVLGRAKRLRPILALASAEVVGGAAARRRALGAGCAIELIHAYSLVHDDLPAMDDDDMRRGRPSVHVRFGVALAILTGDALLTEAFAILSRRTDRLDPERCVGIVAEIATAAGADGMVAGQVVDLASEGRPRLGLKTVQSIHRRKTGALIRAALRVGAIAGGADRSELEQLSAYGEAFGLAFQIADDILDETAEVAKLGKEKGGDRERGKLTYPGLLGLDGARAALSDAARTGHEALAGFARRGAALGALLDHVVRRGA